VHADETENSHSPNEAGTQGNTMQYIGFKEELNYPGGIMIAPPSTVYSHSRGINAKYA